jgi:TetR/AcrR family transcriptional regulator, cholesterol catabolism regulator
MDMPLAAPLAPKRPRGRPRKTVQELEDGNRRRELLNSSARLFRRKGFHATSTRDIAAAAGMQSGSPFYHFASKGALLFAVMQEGMLAAIDRQRRALDEVGYRVTPAQRLRVLVRNHFDVLLGPGSDFIPVMLYEARSLNPRQRRAITDLESEYETAWTLKGDVKLARLLMFGALNWSAQWYDRRKGATLDALTDAAMALFIR